MPGALGDMHSAFHAYKSRKIRGVEFATVREGAFSSDEVVMRIAHLGIGHWAKLVQTAKHGGPTLSQAPAALSYGQDSRGLSWFGCVGVVSVVSTSSQGSKFPWPPVEATHNAGIHDACTKAPGFMPLAGLQRLQQRGCLTAWHVSD